MINETLRQHFSARYSGLMIVSMLTFFVVSCCQLLFFISLLDLTSTLFRQIFFMALIFVMLGTLITLYIPQIWQQSKDYKNFRENLDRASLSVYICIMTLLVLERLLFSDTELFTSVDRAGIAIAFIILVATLGVLSEVFLSATIEVSSPMMIDRDDWPGFSLQIEETDCFLWRVIKTKTGISIFEGKADNWDLAVTEAEEQMVLYYSDQ